MLLATGVSSRLPLPVVSSDDVDRARNNDDHGAALTMQGSLLFFKWNFPNILPEIKKYSEIHDKSIQRLKTIQGSTFLPIPPLHNLLQLGKECASQLLDMLISGLSQPTEEIDILNRSLLHMALDSNLWCAMQNYPERLDDCVFTIDAFGRSPLHIACYRGSRKFVERMINYKADVNVKDIWGKTPLSWAAAGGDKGVVELLLDNEADVNSRDGHGTPICWAAKNGHEGVVKLLLKRGADINFQDGYKTPPDWAAGNGHERVVKLLLKQSQYDASESELLCWAAAEGYKAIVKLLLKRGADINRKSLWGGEHRDPLFLATEYGHWAIVKLLLERRAYVDFRQRGLQLSWAVKHGNEDIVKFLLEEDAYFDWEQRGRLISQALKYGYNDIAKLLLEAGDDVEPEDTCSEE
ncbi:putative ankyrin repeat protein [Ilyonectria robusta]